ncbi:hypothetical protein [Candidatus Uabimicrobium sp. HlEnr_7]|uniref:hypothetical protein n=1 Tax=Candidatus Uabimicrobium helgolandensis TaxID=3095367 RepID=UPI003557C379
MIKAKKIYLSIIIASTILVYYLGILFTELVVFAVAAIIVLLLTFYAFIRGTIILITSSRLLVHYRFHLDVLNNNTIVLEETGFVTPVLNRLKQQIDNSEKQEQHLQLSMQQMNSSNCEGSEDDT